MNAKETAIYFLCGMAGAVALVVAQRLLGRSLPRRSTTKDAGENEEGGQMDKEKKAEAIAAMADSLADFVIRTARDKDAPPEAVRSLPEAAKVALDLLDYC